MDTAVEVIQRAVDVTGLKNHPKEGRDIFDEAIESRSTLLKEGTSELGESERAGLLSDLEELYLAYARQEVEFKQWKKTTEVFGRALDEESPLARNPVVWAAYARFFWAERNKAAKAKKVMHEGLANVAGDESANDRLWLAYLDLLQSPVNDEVDEAEREGMTLAALWAAVADDVDGLIKPSDAAMEGLLLPNGGSAGAAAEGAAGEAVEQRVVDAVLMLGKEWSEISLPSLDDVRGLDAAELMRLYVHEPPSLFTAPHMEPTKGGYGNLENSERIRLESALGSPERTKAAKDVVTCLWMMQALKERHFDAWFSTAKKQHQSKVNTKMARIRMDESKATSSKLRAMQKKHKEEFTHLKEDFVLEEELLKCIINCTLLNLLQLQQRVLTRLGLPYFDARSLATMESPVLEKGAYTYSQEMRKTIFRQANVVGALVSDRVTGYEYDGGPDGGAEAGAASVGNKRRRVDDDQPLAPGTDGAGVKSQLSRLVSRFTR